MIELMEFAEYIAQCAYGPEQDQGAVLTFDGMLHYLNKIKSSKIGEKNLDEYREFKDFTNTLYNMRSLVRFDYSNARRVAAANADPTA